MENRIRDLAKKYRDFISDKNLLINESMKNHTSFKIGGNCDLMLMPKSIEELERVIELADKFEVPWMIIGKGSNMIVKDEGIRGLVIKLDKDFSSVDLKDVVLTAQSGISLRELANFACEHSLSGLEFAHGIPGSLGGAVTMNAGAYAGEMKKVVKTVKLLDKDRKIIVLNNEEMEFAYRSSIVQEKKYVVLEVGFELDLGKKEEISSLMNEYMKRRLDKQPLNYPSAGSVFKRPEGYYAGSLIQDCGLKGLSYGGAKVSEKHAGFIVNTGSATANDVITLIKIIQKTVLDMKNVELEREVKLI